jgi:hypothetical protein
VKWETSRYIIANIPLNSDVLPCIPYPPMLYCYNVNEFFIPSMYCYIFGIPETLLLTPHSFLAYDRTVPNPLSCIATFLTNFSSPFRIATKREFLNCYFTNTSFVSCIRSLFDWFYPAPVISNMAFYYQPNCRSFISDFNICIFSSKFVFRPVD